MTIGGFDKEIVRLLLLVGRNRHIVVHAVDLEDHSAKEFRLALCSVIHIRNPAKASLLLFHIFQKIHISQIDSIKIELIHSNLSL